MNNTAYATASPALLGYDADGNAVYVGSRVNHTEKGFTNGVVTGRGEIYRGEPTVIVDYPCRAGWLNRLSKLRVVAESVAAAPVTPQTPVQTPEAAAPVQTPAPAPATPTAPAFPAVHIVLSGAAIPSDAALTITAGPNGITVEIG